MKTTGKAPAGIAEGSKSICLEELNLHEGNKPGSWTMTRLLDNGADVGQQILSLWILSHAIAKLVCPQMALQMNNHNVAADGNDSAYSSTYYLFSSNLHNH